MSLGNSEESARRCKSVRERLALDCESRTKIFSGAWDVWFDSRHFSATCSICLGIFWFFGKRHMLSSKRRYSQAWKRAY